MSSCALKKPITVRNAPIETYHYAYIPPTQQLTSGGTYGGQYGVYGVTKSVNPADIIAGALIKQGFVILPEVKQELAAETLIVNFSQSGRRNIWGGLWGYTLEVTIQFISAQTHQVICTCNFIVTSVTCKFLHQILSRRFITPHVFEESQRIY